jgi:hypothetical protein
MGKNIRSGVSMPGVLPGPVSECNRELVLKNSVRRRVFPQGSFFRFVFFFW